MQEAGRNRHLAGHQTSRESSSAANRGQFSACTSVAANAESNPAHPERTADVVDSLNVVRVNRTVPVIFDEDVRRNCVPNDWQHTAAAVHPRTGLNLSGGSVQESSQSLHHVSVPEESAVKKKTRGRPGQSEGAKVCGVCGDVARSYHFGGLSCNSCKAFFRRSVQNDMYLQFFCCRGRQNCIITKSSRKSCQHCRMKKCFDAGMQKRWVMTEDERKAVAKARAEKKSAKLEPACAPQKEDSQQSSTGSLSKDSSNTYVPDVSCLIDHMSRAEMKEIESIVTKYADAYKQYPYRAELHACNDKRPGFQVMEILGTVVKRFALYSRMMEKFTSLSSQDQRILLKGGMLEMCMLRGALAFDPVNNRWPNTDMSIYKGAPVLKVEDAMKLVSPSVMEKHLEFIRFLQNLGADEPTIMLLLLVVLFSSRPGLSRPDLVDDYQTHYTSLLKRYTDWRYGPGQSQRLFNKLLTKLSDLRELSETHNRQNLLFGNDELSSIQQQLKDLKISPFPEFNVLGDTGEPKDAVGPARQQASINEHSPGSGSLQKMPTDGASSQTLPANDYAVPDPPPQQNIPESDSVLSSFVHQHFKNTAADVQGQDRWLRELGMKNPTSIASDYSAFHCENAQSQTSSFPSFPGMQFMDMIRQSINHQLDQAYHGPQLRQSDVILSEISNRESTELLSGLRTLFGDQPFSPPSLNAADYEACFDLYRQNDASSTGAESASDESSSQSEAVAVGDPVRASEVILLEEICSQLVKYSESLCNLNEPTYQPT